MKFRLASDLHIEFFNFKDKPVKANEFNSETILPIMPDEKNTVLLLSGDITVADLVDLYRGFFKELSERFKVVLWVPGNHEHYNHDFNQTIEVLQIFARQFGNVFILNNSSYTVDDVEVIGSTLWTDFNRANPASMLYATMYMSDFAGQIGYSFDKYDGDKKERIMGRWTPELSVTEHAIAKLFISERLKKKTKPKTIVMTHHAPSEQSVSPKYKGSMLNPAFYSNLDDFVIEYEPDIWLHGHVHQNFDYMIGKTRVIANPLGYGGLTHHENPIFSNKFVIEL